MTIALIAGAAVLVGGLLVLGLRAMRRGPRQQHRHLTVAQLRARLAQEYAQPHHETGPPADSRARASDNTTGESTRAPDRTADPSHR